MTRYTLRVFGLAVLSVDITDYEEVEESAPVFGGGSSHNFERDYEPLSPTSHHEWEWEDKRKGFGFV